MSEGQGQATERKVNSQSRKVSRRDRPLCRKDESRQRALQGCREEVYALGEGVSGAVDAASMACASPRVTTRGRGVESSTAS